MPLTLGATVLKARFGLSWSQKFVAQQIFSAFEESEQGSFDSKFKNGGYSVSGFTSPQVCCFSVRLFAFV